MEIDLLGGICPLNRSLILWEAAYGLMSVHQLLGFLIVNLIGLYWVELGRYLVICLEEIISFESNFQTVILFLNVLSLFEVTEIHLLTSTPSSHNLDTDQETP